MKFSSLSALKIVKMLAKLMENVVNTQLGPVLPLRHDTVACLLMPQSHPTTGPVQFLAPVRFLAHKAEWSARRNFTPVLFSWSHQATAWQGCTVMAWSNNNSQDSTWTPCGARMGVVWAPHGNVQCFPPYGEAKFVTAPHVRAPWVDVRFLFKTAREQQSARDSGVWCDRAVCLKAALPLVRRLCDRITGPSCSRWCDCVCAAAKRNVLSRVSLWHGPI